MLTQSLKSSSIGRLITSKSPLIQHFCAATSIEAQTPQSAVIEDAPSAETWPDKEDTARTMWHLYRRLSVIGATKDKVTTVLDAYVREGRVIGKIDLLNCLRKLRSYKRHQHCLEIFEWMDKMKYNYSHRDQALRLDLICKTKGVASAEKFFESLTEENKNLYTYGALLNCYCVEKLKDKAAKLLEEMEKLNFVSNLTFNNLMTLALTTGEPEKVPALVEEMKSRSLAMSSFTYSLLIQSYHQLNDMEAVERIVQEIEKEEGGDCQWNIYSNLAAVYIRKSDFEKAEMALKKLEEASKNLQDGNPLPYHYLITLYAGMGNFAEVIRIWEYVKSQFKSISNITYITLLSSLLKLDQQDELVKSYKEWESNYKHFDSRIPSIMMAGYMKQNMIEEAEKVFNDAVEKSKSGFFKGREMLVAHFLNKGEINRVLEHLEAASDANVIKESEIWRPPPHRILEFFECLEKEKDVEGAERLIKLLRKLKCLKSESYLWLLKTYVAADKTASDIRERMKEDGFEITSDHEVMLEKVCPQ